MTVHIVGIGELAVSKTRGDTIRTFALGSCVGVVLVDAASGTTGMLHLVLPNGTGYTERSSRNPAYFADSGIPALIAAMTEVAGKPTGKWVCKLAGGANVLTHPGPENMDIGRRNVLAARQQLQRFSLSPVAEDVGRHHSRTVSVAVGNPKLLIENRRIGNITI